MISNEVKDIIIYVRKWEMVEQWSSGSVSLGLEKIVDL